MKMSPDITDDWQVGVMAAKTTTGGRRGRLVSIVCGIAVAVFGVAAVIAVDVDRYLHWQSPVVAVARVEDDSGTAVRKLRGLWYSAASIDDGTNRYQALVPGLSSGGPCVEQAETMLRLTREAVFRRHDPSIIDWDDGIAGVWVAGCSADASTATVYAIAVHETFDERLLTDGLSPEKVTIDITERRNWTASSVEDAAWDKGRSVQDSEKYYDLFPQYVSTMWRFTHFSTDLRTW